MRLVVGLGNPGARYADTRHNVGWLVLERLAARWRAAAEPAEERYATWRAHTARGDVVLMRPLTFMNASGEAVLEWRETRPGEPEELLVVSDDVYLPLGRLRLRARGSSGGHRGLDSIEAALGTREFARLRIGVGEADSGAALREHVLDTFAAEERPVIDAAVADAAEAVACWAEQGLTEAMNRYNRKEPKEESES